MEEILRWEPPIHHFRRTATADVVLGGQPIAHGDKVLMWYAGSNRDPAVFDDPHAFRIDRSPNPHQSFGLGEHFCMGASLGRLSLRLASPSCWPRSRTSSWSRRLGGSTRT